MQGTAPAGLRLRHLTPRSIFSHPRYHQQPASSGPYTRGTSNLEWAVASSSRSINWNILLIFFLPFLSMWQLSLPSLFPLLYVAVAPSTFS